MIFTSKLGVWRLQRLLWYWRSVWRRTPRDMRLNSHGDYSATYFPITSWPMQSNPIPPPPSPHALAASSICVDLLPVECIVMSSCELGTGMDWTSLHSRRCCISVCVCVCGLLHVRAILVYVCLRHCILFFFFWFIISKNKLLYNANQVFQMPRVTSFPHASLQRN